MKKIINLLKNTITVWNNREAPRMGASLAFYSILSLAPLVILVVSICALAFGTAGAQSQILEQFRAMVGNEGATAIEAVLKSAQKPTTGILASAFGLLTLLFGASGVFVELRAALNILWEVQPVGSSNGGLWHLIKDRFLSFGMVLAIGFLLLVSLAVSAGLGAVGKYFSSLGVLPPAAWEAVNFIVSLGGVAGLFALIFRFVPNIRLPWPYILRGAVLTAALFTLGKTIIGIYLGKAGVGSAYGAAGSLVVLVVWIYYSAQIFYLGATFTRVYAQSRGWQPERRLDVTAHPMAAPVAANTPSSSRSTADAPERSQSTFARIVAAGLVVAGLLRKSAIASKK